MASSSPLRPWLELIRLPNVFTALADVSMGFLVTHGSLAPWSLSLPLLASSASLYIAGMVLNDVFDVELDRHERPQRPLPSGRIALPAAQKLGWGLLALGVLLAWLLLPLAGRWHSGVVATLLAGAIVAYNVLLKRFWLGPVGMGLCRGLNVLLGMSAAVEVWHLGHYTIAFGIGLYIVGVTWFARTEATMSRRSHLIHALDTMLIAFVLLAFFPRWTPADIPPEVAPRYVAELGPRWYALWAVVCVLTLWRGVWAALDPHPRRVQIAVKFFILSLVMLDAVVTFAFAGPTWGITVLALVVPAMLLGRFIYST